MKYRPMLCQVADRPLSSPRWIGEVKYDGCRALAYGPKLISRSGASISQFPELETPLSSIDAVLDGEIVVFRGGAPDFPATAGRIHLTNSVQIALRARTIPATYMVFDILEHRGKPALGLPLWERRRLLETLGLGGRLQLSPAVRGEEIGRLLEVVKAKGWEGVVMKDLDAPYRPGQRSPAWLKLKVLHEAEFIVGGITRGEGWREDTLGSLLLGQWREGELQFRGEVGTGFNRRDLGLILARLSPHLTDHCPFTPRPRVEGLMSWARPVVTVEVAYHQITPDGHLRFPSFKGIK